MRMKMNFSNVHEVDRKIRSSTARKKPRVIYRIGSAFNITSHRKNSPRKQHYWTSGHENLSERKNIKDEQSPFVYLSCSQTVAYLQWWRAKKKRAISARDKRKFKDQDNYKTLQTRNILQRLHVDVEIEAEEAKKHKDLDKAIAITDMNPEYFTELSGRPVGEKCLLKQYVQDTREILKTKLLIGQEKDDCIRIDQQFEQEEQRLRKIQYRNRRYVSSFEEFLSKDHEKSMDMLNKAEQEAKLTEKISNRRNELSKELGQVRLDVYFWEENWRTVKMCQIFLYRISPIAWRMKHDWLHRSESRRSTVTDITDFSRYQTVDEDASLEDLIELFEQDISYAGPADLYFEDPFELMRIFRTMETQNLNVLIHLESLAAPMADMAITITVIEAQIKQEVDEISSTIDDLENSIAKAEARAADLEEYANYLLHGIFRHLVCSEEVLYLHVFVEDAYESCVGPNDANLDSFSMMKWIEKTHEELNLQLDNLPRDIVQTCEKEGFRQETKIIKEAEDAARKFELMHRLLDALRRIVEPPARKKRPLIRRSVPVMIKAKPPPLSPKPTSEEAQYLAFFTDYSKRDDFTEYRSKFPDDFDLTFQSRRTDIEIEISTPTDEYLEEEEEDKRVAIEKVAEVEVTDLLENSSCVYIPKGRISLMHRASSIFSSYY